MLDALPPEVIIQPAPATFVQAQQAFEHIAGRAFNASTEKLTSILSGKLPVSNAEFVNGQYLYGSIRQASLGFGRLIQMASDKPGAAVTFSYTPGGMLILRVAGDPTLPLCDAMRKLFVGGIWEASGLIAKNKVQNVTSTFNEAGMQNFARFTPQNAEYAIRKMLAMHGRLRMPDGDISPVVTGVEWRVFPSTLTCLRGRMTVIGNNTYMPMFTEGPQPGLFKP